ncbi:50S ribosomal protein L18 [Candidatus Fermentibacteria bacterium]|nr:MAG: 50S ribosomal protein L18 [Candidatus Fermentibacteria bacterium]
MAKLTRKQRLSRRHRRIRKHVSGTPERPRLFVRRSLRHMVACLIDDVEGKTLLALTTDSAKFRAAVSGSKTSQAEALGTCLAEKAKEQGITRVVFDRGGHPYHGRVKALAEKARENGLEF